MGRLDDGNVGALWLKEVKIVSITQDIALKHD